MKMINKNSQIKLIIFDIDNTLVKPKTKGFYGLYSQAVDKAVSEYLGVSIEQGKVIADYYRKNFGGGEKALFLGNISEHFPEYKSNIPNYTLLYDELVKIDPLPHFVNDEKIKKILNILKYKGIKRVGLTSSPDILSKKILSAVGIDSQKDFDLFIAYERKSGPPKMVKAEIIFNFIRLKFNLAEDEMLSLGDSYLEDVKPAQNLGMYGALITDKPVDFDVAKFQNVYEAINSFI